MKERPYITLAQAQAAMDAMLKKAMEQPHRPVAMAIVDDAGVLLAYQQMDGLRMFTRRHAIRKACTAANTGMNSGQFGEDCLKARGTTVREIGGDLELTPGAGGVVVRASRHAPRSPTSTSWVESGSAATSPAARMRSSRRSALGRWISSSRESDDLARSSFGLH